MMMMMMMMEMILSCHTGHTDVGWYWRSGVEVFLLNKQRTQEENTVVAAAESNPCIRLMLHAKNEKHPKKNKISKTLHQDLAEKETSEISNGCLWGFQTAQQKSQTESKELIIPLAPVLLRKKKKRQGKTKRRLQALGVIEKKIYIYIW